MRIGELSRRSGVPIPTIKYYLREGLLPPGASTAANQATYDEEHLRRLRLIRALVDVGGVSVAATRDVIEALSGTGLDLMTLFGIVHEAVIPRRRPDAQARDQAAAVVAAHGWNVHPESSSLDLLADALAAVAALEVTTILDRLDTYAELARTLAAAEVDSVLGQPDDAQRLESVVLGTVLGERVFSALRLLAHQHESARRLDPAGGRLDRAKDGSPRG